MNNITIKDVITKLARMKNSNPLQFDKHWSEWFEQSIKESLEAIKLKESKSEFAIKEQQELIDKYLNKK